MKELKQFCDLLIAADGMAGIKNRADQILDSLDVKRDSIKRIQIYDILVYCVVMGAYGALDKDIREINKKVMD